MILNYYKNWEKKPRNILAFRPVNIVCNPCCEPTLASEETVSDLLRSTIWGDVRSSFTPQGRCECCYKHRYKPSWTGAEVSWDNTGGVIKSLAFVQMCRRNKFSIEFISAGYSEFGLAHCKTPAWQCRGGGTIPHRRRATEPQPCREEYASNLTLWNNILENGASCKKSPEVFGV